MTNSIRTFLLLTLSTILCLSSCRLQDPDLSPAPTAVLDRGGNGEGGAECVPEERRFDLSFSVVKGTNNREWTVKIITGVFPGDECMCKVTGFELEVAQATGSDWELFRVDNVPIDWFLQSGIGFSYDSLIIDDVEQFFDGGGYNSDLPLKALYTANPPWAPGVLVKATGLCIIENFDGFDPGVPATFYSLPIVELVPATPPATGFIHNVLIPIGITIPN